MDQPVVSGDEEPPLRQLAAPKGKARRHPPKVGEDTGLRGSDLGIDQDVMWHKGRLLTQYPVF